MITLRDWICLKGERGGIIADVDSLHRVNIWIWENEIYDYVSCQSFIYPAGHELCLLDNMPFLF